MLRKEDSLRRIGYSIINTFLGVMCLSGDICDLSADLWKVVEEGISFYREAGEIIRDGVSAFHGTEQKSWRHPEGWQAVVRTLGHQSLIVAHSFHLEPGTDVTANIPLLLSSRVERSFCTEDIPVHFSGTSLQIEFKASFQAMAILIQEESFPF